MLGLVGLNCDGVTAAAYGLRSGRGGTGWSRALRDGVGRLKRASGGLYVCGVTKPSRTYSPWEASNGL